MTIVKMPFRDGFYALWSGVSDDFEMLGLTKEYILFYYLLSGGIRAYESALDSFTCIEECGKSNKTQFAMDWNDCIC